MRLAIRHTTRYGFSFPVVHGLHRLRLKPKSSHGQQVLDWTMAFEGAQPQADYDDHNNNGVVLVSVEPGAMGITVTCNGTVDTADSAGVLGPHSGYMPLWNFLTQTEITKPGPKVRALLAGLEGRGGSALDMLHTLSDKVLEAVSYDLGYTDAATTAEDALAVGHGVCQDHAHIFIGAARALGIPARYVSGYLLIDDKVEQEAGHGWAEAHVEGLGWVGFDVSNAMAPDARYVRVATGCDYRDAAPITGICVGAGETSLEVSLAVERQTIAQ